MARKPSTNRRATAKRGSPSYSTEQRETVRSGLRIPARMTARAHVRRQASPFSAFPPPRKSATVSYGLCNPDPTSVAYINATLSYGICIPTPERTRKSKCSLFVSCREVIRRLLEGIIESVDEYYSENLAQEVVRGMREAASRGFFLGSNAPFGYRKIKVSDGAKERPTLEVDPATAPVVKELFEKSLRGSGLKELCKELNDRGITNRGKRWYKGTLHYVLRNEAYTGTAVWGKTSKGQEAQDPVRVEEAWPALVSRELFEDVQQAMSDRAPKVQRPGRVGSKFLLSGLLKCGVCGRPYSAKGAKSGQFAYYICGTLFREGAGTCSARYLNAPKLEAFVVEKVLDFG